jgi:hypothetical protein
VREKFGESIGDPIFFDELRNASRRGDWDFVSQGMSKVCKEFQFFEYAVGCAIGNEDPNLRIFGAMFIEKSSEKLNHDQIKLFKKIMKKDKNHQVRYGMAFALFSHDIRSGDVVGTIKKALKDPNLEEKAQGYLDQLINNHKKFFIFGRDAGN